MVISVMLWAAGVGLGLWFVALWVFPPAPSLNSLIVGLKATPPRSSLLISDTDGWATRLGRPFVSTLRDLGLPAHGIRHDLAITGRSSDSYLADKAALGLAGMFLPPALGLVLSLADRPLPWLMPAIGSVAAATVGFLLPDIVIRAQAKRRRSDFRHALSFYLDLIDILLAGGVGVDGAISYAASVGHHWSFRQLRRALTTARVARTSPWIAIGQLGEELDVPELTKLAATLSLAGTEGAQVRQTLVDSSDALGSKLCSATEAQANSATERMIIPAILMAFGFVIFVFYAALSQGIGSL